MKAAFVLVKCHLGKLEEVANALMELEGVSEVHSITGAWDLLVKLYESGPDPSPDLAFMWAWIGQARTWDPGLTPRAAEDFDRLQDRTRRDIRLQGIDLARKWLDEHPRPAFPQAR